jgi:glycosyltransferase involved in cell wall biosynthesis
VTVYTTDATGTDKPLSIPRGRPVDMAGVRVYHFASTFGPKSMFASRSLIKQMKRTVSQFDAVYIAGWFMWIGIAAARICQKAGVAVVAGTHGGFTVAALRQSNLKKKVYWQLFLKRSFKNVAVFRLTSKMEEECSQRSLDGRPRIVVPNPVDPEIFQPYLDRRARFRDRHGIPPDAPALIAVTRFDWMKRVDLLMEAVSKRDAWWLVLVGDDRGGTAKDLKARAEALGLGRRVVWTGYLQGEELCTALSACDLSALISETDNFGNVVVEAMMCGLPVLVSKGVGVHEYIREAPFVLTAGLSQESTVEALATAEDRLSTFRADRDRIRRYAIDRFAPETVAERFADALGKMLKERQK